MSLNENQKKLLERFAAGATAFDRFIGAELPAGLVDFRPALDDAWTIREHIAHFADAEAHAYIRFKFAVAEPGISIVAFDEFKWFDRLRYGQEPLEEVVPLYRHLRNAAYRLVAGVEAAWEDCFVVHPASGRIDMGYLLKVYTDHLDVHLEYIARNEALWKKTRN